MPMNLCKFIHTVIIGAPQQVLPQFSMFQGEMDPDSLPRELNKYNDTGNVMNILDKNTKGGSK